MTPEEAGMTPEGADLTIKIMAALWNAGIVGSCTDSGTLKVAAINGTEYEIKLRRLSG
jgi:hypothetical protein